MTVLTKEELESIRKRAEAATPGPWFWLDDGRLYSDGADKVIGEVIEGKDETWFDLFDANAEFIAHAREDIPKLLAEIERLQQEKDEWYEKYMRLDATVSTQNKQLEKANAEIKRMLAEASSDMFR